MDYVASKVAHMKRIGIAAGFSDDTGAAIPDHREQAKKEELARQNRQLIRRQQFQLRQEN